MDGYRSDTYGENFADVYDDWYGNVSDTAAATDKIVSLAGGGLVLELGTGTGRLAIPLAELGVEVVGLDASRSMIDVLESKTGGDLVTTVVADMSELPFRASRFSLAFAAFNTFFNLATETQQIRCLSDLSHTIRPGGLLVVEGFLPPEGGLADDGVSLKDITLETAILSVSRHDAVSQQIVGHHIEIAESGIRMRPWMIRYLTPIQLDRLAGDAGFDLENRWAGWNDEKFDPAGDVHVSVYRLSAQDH